MKIALVGDYDAAVVAHQAIPGALELSARALATRVESIWIHSSEIDLATIANVDALWCVPLSPYTDADAVINAIRYARENDLPFLGTCAGFQHAVLEYARNVLEFEDADSIEDNANTSMPLITALGCRLSDQAQSIFLDPGSQLAAIYQAEQIVEEYNCGFGVNPVYLSIFAASEFRFSAHDENGEPRAFELGSGRFFFGTAWQPERSSLNQYTHPLITGFLTAALNS